MNFLAEIYTDDVVHISTLNLIADAYGLHGPYLNGYLIPEMYRSYGPYNMEFVAGMYGRCSPCMDFLPEIYGPYSPPMDFVPEICGPYGLQVEFVPEIS